MKSFSSRFIALCGLTVLTAAMLAPMAVWAGCPKFIVDCGGGSLLLLRGNTRRRPLHL